MNVLGCMQVSFESSYDVFTEENMNKLKWRSQKRLISTVGELYQARLLKEKLFGWCSNTDKNKIVLILKPIRDDMVNPRQEHHGSIKCLITLEHKQTFEVSLNYANLAALDTKSYAGKSKINSEKEKPLAGIEPKASCGLLRYLSNCVIKPCVG